MPERRLRLLDQRLPAARVGDVELDEEGVAAQRDRELLAASDVQVGGDALLDEPPDVGLPPFP
ncbi:hypothetical protein ACFWMX_32170 [Streptomyces sp. NPDC058378]|uniref:hypothetical protein n=1 Tax=Streptomyces sp. NPDC058378 TaxID=3346469 RepID=UPI003665263C